MYEIHLLEQRLCSSLSFGGLGRLFRSPVTTSHQILTITDNPPLFIVLQSILSSWCVVSLQYTLTEWGNEIKIVQCLWIMVEDSHQFTPKNRKWRGPSSDKWNNMLQPVLCAFCYWRGKWHSWINQTYGKLFTSKCRYLYPGRSASKQAWA